MGVIIPSFRRPVVAVIGGKQIRSMEQVAAISDATVLRTKEGDEAGSRVDGSEYLTVFAQVKPGTVARITGYGAEDCAKLAALKEGDVISAFVTPMGRFGRGYKLCELAEVHPAVVEAAQADQPEVENQEQAS